MRKDELLDVSECKELYEQLGDTIKVKVKSPSTFREIQVHAKKLFENNARVLGDNIMGRQFLINEKFEDGILNTLGLKRQEIQKAISESEYYLKFQNANALKLNDQLIFALPLIMAANEYERLKKHEEANFIFMLTFFKPYASRIFYWFGKYGVNEDRMADTVERKLTERFDIKRYGTIYEVIEKKAFNSFENYLKNSKSDITDMQLDIIYKSGVATRVNDFINKVAIEYNKNNDYLAFEDSGMASYDKDTDSSDFVDRDIESDAAVKMKIVNKVVLRVNKDPVDNELIRVAAKHGFKSDSQLYQNILKNVILEVSDKMIKQIPDFYSSLIGAFLFEINPATKKRFTMPDFKSPIFIRKAEDILLNNPNTKNVNQLKVKEILREMLEDHSAEYLRFGTTQKTNMRKALAFYWILLVKNNK